MRRSLFKSPVSGGRDPRLRFTKRTAGAAIGGGVATLATVGAIVASAAVPTFPDNVVVFPERDFVAIEGWEGKATQEALVEVTRAGKVVGSAKGILSGGDPALEINHPGGVCWGAGTGLSVTPDIQEGDVVSIKVGGDNLGETTVADASVTEHATLGSDGVTVTVKGKIAAGVSQSQFEQRIVNPDLTDLIGRRDVRALPGPLTPSEKGGYESGVTFDGNGGFEATYVFDDTEAAKIAAGTQVERVLSWQVEDGDANRQGLTISEFGESGGPGMGGCPAGPADAAAPAASYAVTRSADGSTLGVKWTPAQAVPGAAAVTGYDVEAIAPDGTTVGARTNATTTGANIPVKAGTEYTVEVRSLAGAKMSEPFTKFEQGPAPDLGDVTPPELKYEPALGADGAVVETNEVKLSSESGADIFYTTDGSSVLGDGDITSDTAVLYDPSKPIAITGPTTVNAVAFDRAGNFVTATGQFAPPNTAPIPAPLAPADLAGTPGNGSVNLTWKAAENATSYQVTVYNADGTQALPALNQPGETSQTAQTVAGLNGSTAYQFTVTAINATGRSPESAKVRVLLPERLTIGTARWKTGDMRVSGTSSALSGTVRVYRSVRNATTGALEPGAQIGTLSATLTAAVAPATGTTYDWRLRNGVPTTNPGQVFVRSTNGGVAGPFTVANG